MGGGRKIILGTIGVDFWAQKKSISGRKKAISGARLHTNGAIPVPYVPDLQLNGFTQFVFCFCLFCV